MTQHELSCEIHDNGMWEEFHQKRGNFTMYDHHKSRRLQLQRTYHDRNLSQSRTDELLPVSPRS